MRTIAMLLVLAVPAGAGEPMGPSPPVARLEAREAPRQPWGWQEGVIVGTALADLASTEALLARGGYAEGNPLMKGQAIRLAAKAAATAGVIHLHRKYKKKGEHGKARTVLIIAASVWGGAFVWNAHHLKGIEP